VPDLLTARLHIRPYIQTDLQARHALICEAFNERVEIEQTQAWLGWAIANYAQLASLHQPPYGDYAVALRETGDVIGSVGLVQSIVPWGVFPHLRAPHEPPHELVNAEFGLFWAIRVAHQQRGYATEAAQAFITWAFHDLYIKRVVATTEHDNIASQRIMHKLGMRLERNPGTRPFWCQVVGVLENPRLSASAG
jgi:[ribosomal protein S5]-alanine N-acetyltransferase